MKKFPALVLFFLFIMTINAQVYPPPAGLAYHNGVLSVYPPDSVPAYTGGLLSYNIYLDGEFMESVPALSPTDTINYTFDPLP